MPLQANIYIYINDSIKRKINERKNQSEKNTDRMEKNGFTTFWEMYMIYYYFRRWL